MRSLLDVRTEIAELMEEGNGISIFIDDPEYSAKNRRKNRIRKRLQFLRMVEKYLEETPLDDFIQKEIFRLENRIELIGNQFDPSNYKDATEPRKEYEKEMGVPHLKLQLKALYFIKK